MEPAEACGLFGIAKMAPFRNNPCVPAKVELPKGKFGSILIDPPWRFSNSTGKVAPEHKRLHLGLLKQPPVETA
jgi:hypothetical protein